MPKRTSKKTKRAKGESQKPPRVFVVLGHGATYPRGVAEKYVISTPPGHYSFSNPGQDVNFMTTLSNLYSENQGISLKKSVEIMEHFRESFFDEMSGIVYLPDKMDADLSDDSYGEEKLWRETTDNLVIYPADPEIMTGSTKTWCKDKSKFTELYTPYGIYDIESFSGRELLKSMPNEEYLKEIQKSKANITGEVLKKFSQMRIDVNKGYHTGRGEPASSASIVSYCGIKHYPYLILSDLQNALGKMYPFRDVRVYLNLCRVYQGDHERGDVLGTIRHRYEILGTNVSFKYQWAINLKTKEIQYLKDILQSRKPPPWSSQDQLSLKDVQTYQKQIKEKTKELEKIQEKIRVDTGLSNMIDSISVLDIADESEKTRKQPKKRETKRKKRKKTRGIKKKRKSESKKHTKINK